MTPSRARRGPRESTPGSSRSTAVPPELSGLRTLFNALHHFDRDGARAVLADAVRARQPILCAELSERTFTNVVGALLIPLFVLALMPFVRPLRASWLALTYLVPVLPFAIAWDGLVSHLRVHSPAELAELTEGLDDGYRWRIGQDRFGPGRITWLIGTPTAE